MIPKIIHFIWLGGRPPWWAEKNVSMFKTLNPDFDVRWHVDEKAPWWAESNVSMFRALDPNFEVRWCLVEQTLLEGFRHAYQRIDENPEHVYERRSDVLRVCALLEHGGWYFDCDFMPIRPLRDLYAEYGHFPSGCFLTRCANHPQTGREIIANGVIATTPDSPMLAMIATGIICAADTERELGWNAYGPHLYTRLAGLQPQLVRIGAMTDFYRIEDRDESIAAYKRIAAADFTFDSQVKELGTPMPHMFHMAMQGDVEL